MPFFKKAEDPAIFDLDKCKNLDNFKNSAIAMLKTVVQVDLLPSPSIAQFIERKYGPPIARATTSEQVVLQLAAAVDRSYEETMASFKKNNKTDKQIGELVEKITPLYGQVKEFDDFQKKFFPTPEGKPGFKP